MNTIGFLGGCAGDICMGAVAAKHYKRMYPHSTVRLAVSKKYDYMIPIMRLCPHFDFKNPPIIWEGYDDFPTCNDGVRIVAGLSGYKIFSPNAKHIQNDWYLYRHQTEEILHMYGLYNPDLKIDTQIEFCIPEGYAQSNPKTIALSLFGETRGHQKNISIDKGKRLVKMIEGMGYETLQLGLASEPLLGGERFSGTMEESFKQMLGCDLLITVDTAMAWAASGTKKKVVGLYGWGYYPGAKSSHNWQPTNPNAVYLEEYNCNQISDDRIEEAIKTQLQ